MVALPRGSNFAVLGVFSSNKFVRLGQTFLCQSLGPTGRHAMQREISNIRCWKSDFANDKDEVLSV